MHKMLISLLAAMVAFTMTVSTASDAEARRYHRGGALAFGIAAAVVGGIALHQSHRRYSRGYGYSSYGYDDYGYDDYPRYRRSYSYYRPAPIYYSDYYSSDDYGYSRSYRHSRRDYRHSGYKQRHFDRRAHRYGGHGSRLIRW